MPIIIPKSPPVAAISTADHSITSNDSVFEDDAYLTVQINPNTQWVVEWDLSATFSTTGQIKLQVVVPTGYSLTCVDAQMFTSDGVLVRGQVDADNRPIVLDSITGTSANIKVRASVITTLTSPQDYITLQYCQAVSDATPTIIKTGSSMVAVQQ